MIIGTAGHVDHGKTSLVKALTGVDTDRLKAEKERGITLELGFAHLDLPGGGTAGVVDVPGHERFVKAMAAGAGGVDLAVLVVAADEGVRPQTREHLDICRLLGVRGGVVAITKSDLAGELGPEWIELLKGDVAQLVAGTFLEGAAMVPCSAVTGEGLFALKEALARLAKALPERAAEGPAFLPVDRAFTLKGFGTVVTGPLLSGLLAQEEEVSLLPDLPGPFRVRGLQAYGRPVPRVAAGQRVAVNVGGVAAEAVSRGQVLTRAGELLPTRMLDVEVELLSAAEKPLPRRRKLLLHLGTQQAEATLALLDSSELRPGEKALGQLRLAVEVVSLPGQRFILRGSQTLPGRGTTLAGGRVLNAAATRRRKGASEALRPLLAGDPEARLTFWAQEAGYRGLTPKEAFARSGLGQKGVARALEVLTANGALVLVDKERRLHVAQSVLEGLLSRSLSLLTAFHAEQPLKEGLSKEALRRKLSPELDVKLFAKVVQLLTASNRVESKGDVLKLAGKGQALSGQDESVRSRLLAALDSAGLAPPRVAELATTAGAPAARIQELLQVLVAQGQVARVAEELYFGRRAVEGLKERLVAHLKEHREITTQAFKELVGQSRKFVIPLSEYFDRERVTLRVGERRVLRKG